MVTQAQITETCLLSSPKPRNWVWRRLPRCRVHCAPDKAEWFRCMLKKSCRIHPTDPTPRFTF